MSQLQVTFLPPVTVGGRRPFREWCFAGLGERPVPRKVNSKFRPNPSFRFPETGHARSYSITLYALFRNDRRELTGLARLITGANATMRLALMALDQSLSIWRTGRSPFCSGRDSAGGGLLLVGTACPTCVCCCAGGRFWPLLETSRCLTVFGRHFWVYSLLPLASRHSKICADALANQIARAPLKINRNRFNASSFWPGIDAHGVTCSSALHGPSWKPLAFAFFACHNMNSAERLAPPRRIITSLDISRRSMVLASLRSRNS
jgi:hypothetical protein